MSKHVLIADDEPNILISLEFLMKREGYRCGRARRRRCARGHRARTARPGAARRDDAGQDGLRGLPGGARRRGAGGREDPACSPPRAATPTSPRALALGADAYMTKPFSTKELADQVRATAGGPGMKFHWRERRRPRWPRALVLALWLRSAAAALLRGDARARRTRCSGHACSSRAHRADRAGLAAAVGGARRRAARRLAALGRGAGAAGRAGAACCWPPTCSARSAPRAAPRTACAGRSRSTRSCAQRAAAAATDIADAGAGGQPRGRAGAQPPGRADVRADAERRRVQPRRPHPALQQPRAPAVPRAVAVRRRWPDGAELIGLGRSIYAVLDRKLVAHALESVQQRLQRGAAQPLGAVRHEHPRRAVAARADGAGARDGAAAADRRRRRARR